MKSMMDDDQRTIQRLYNYNSDESYEDGDLEIDLEFENEKVLSIHEQDEPLDLSMKKISDDYLIDKVTLPTLDISQKFNLDIKEKKPNNSNSDNSNKGSVVTEDEIFKLLDPYVKKVRKKFTCTICDIKFINKVKAVTHVENKHVECLQYKCPLCRASKGTRLAYESHLRRGHSANVRDYSPVIRCKKIFEVKSESQISNKESQVAQQYDLDFVTFLRISLSPTGKSDSDPQARLAEWVDHEQGIFRINNKSLFARSWYMFKGIECGTWDQLYTSVLMEFIDRSIIKQLGSDGLVFQVFCIKQLLK